MSDALAAMLPWLVVLLALVVAGLSIYEWSLQATEAADLDAAAESVAGLNQRLQAMSRTLQSAVPVSKRQSWSAATASAVPATPSRAAQAPPPRGPVLDTVLAAADRWFTAVGQRPRSVDDLYQRLRSLSGSLDVADPNRITKESRGLAQAALAYSDDHELFDDAATQGELTRLLAALGLSLVNPRQGDRCDPALHQMMGRDSAPNPQSTRLISKVVRRGLQDRLGIISKAEVRVYD